MGQIKDFIDEIEEMSGENIYFRGESKIYSTIGSGIHRYCAEPSRLNVYGQSNVIGAINLVLNPSPNRHYNDLNNRSFITPGSKV